MSEAEAVLLDRTLRWSEPETALEQGWLLEELEQRFHYGLDELARQFDRSVSWVSRRLALVELLPESIQQQMREGKLSAQVAMKFLVPVARHELAACQRMAAIFALYHCDTRQAGELYASVAQRLAGGPQADSRCARSILQNAAASRAEARCTTGARVGAGPGDGGGDHEPSAAAISRGGGGGDGRATARSGAAADSSARQKQLGTRSTKPSPRSKSRMLSQAQRTTILELHTKGVASGRLHACWESLVRACARYCGRSNCSGSGVAGSREGRTSPATHSGSVQQLQGESRASP